MAVQQASSNLKIEVQLKSRILNKTFPSKMLIWKLFSFFIEFDILWRANTYAQAFCLAIFDDVWSAPKPPACTHTIPLKLDSQAVVETLTSFFKIHSGHLCHWLG